MVTINATALTPVTLKPDCGYVYNEFEQSPSGFDAMAEQIIFIMSLTEYEVPLDDWMSADLEMTDYVITGDGIPDSYQLAMLGAALCAGDPEITSEFQSNQREFDEFMEELEQGIAAVDVMGDKMRAVLAQLEPWVAGLPAGTLKSDGEDLIYIMTDTADAVDRIMLMVNLISDALPDFRDWFAAFAGLSSEAKQTIDELTGKVVWNFYSYCAANPMSYMYLMDEIAYLTELANNTTHPMQADMSLDCLGLADTITDFWEFAETMTIPYFTIYGANGAKSIGEPFSAVGDYNGDGMTNKEAYDLVEAAGGDRTTFVQAAASDNGLWKGNPALPAAELTTLVAMALGLAAAGAVRMRKR